MVLPLSHIPSAADARVIWIASDTVKQERLEKRGVVPGAIIHCVCRSRRRHFFLFRINGRLILLPQKLAREIFAEIQK